MDPIESRFADVNGCRASLPDRRQRRPRAASARLRPDQPYVAAAHPGARQDAHGDRARSARLRGFGQAGGRLRQEDDGAGHPRARRFARAHAHRHCRSRYRADGRLCLCRAVSGGGRADRLDGRVPSRRGRLDERLAAARSLAFPFLRQDAASAGRGTGAHLLRTFLERLRGGPLAFRVRGGPPVLCRGLCAARRA